MTQLVFNELYGFLLESQLRVINNLRFGKNINHDLVCKFNCYKLIKNHNFLCFFETKNKVIIKITINYSDSKDKLMEMKKLNNFDRFITFEKKDLKEAYICVNKLGNCTL